MVDAIILAGGLGTRLAPVVPHLPKALAPIHQTPFLQILLNQLQNSHIVSKIILALGHKATSIQTFAPHIECSIESIPLGTGGALLHALDKTTSSTLLVLNGDTHFDLPLDAFLNFHRTVNADITLACRQVADVSRYGSIFINAEQKITSFQEKSPVSKPGLISAGIYLIEKKLLTPFTPGTYSLETDLFPLFLQKNFYAFPHQASFIDIGTPNSYNEAQEILKPWVPQ